MQSLEISPLVWDCRGSLPFGFPSELLAFCTSWIWVLVRFLFTFSICPYLLSNIRAKPYFCFPAGLSLTLSLIQSKWFLSKYSFDYLTLLPLQAVCWCQIQLKHWVCWCSYTAWQAFSLGHYGQAGQTGQPLTKSEGRVWNLITSMEEGLKEDCMLRISLVCVWDEKFNRFDFSKSG